MNRADYDAGYHDAYYDEPMRDYASDSYYAGFDDGAHEAMREGHMADDFDETLAYEADGEIAGLFEFAAEEWNI